MSKIERESRSETDMHSRYKKNKRSLAKTIAMVGIMAATVECAKLVLAPLPNVEAVTLLLALYGYCFGALGVLASVIFVCIEPLIWGVNLWVISYFLYWPFVALLFAFFRKVRLRNRWILALAAVLMTVWFGILSSLIDVGLFSGYWDNFFYRFSIYYLRGVWFYFIQTCCNAVLFTLLFPMLSNKLCKLSI